MRKQAKILTVKVDSTSLDRVLRIVSSKLIKKQKFFVVTPNPEQLMRAEKDIKFRKILNEADISIADGVGLVAAYSFMNLPYPKLYFLRPIHMFIQGLWVGFSIIINRKGLEKDLKVIRGRELFLELIKMSNKRHLRVYFLGGMGDEAKKTKDVLSRNYKSVKIFSNAGPLLDMDGSPKKAADKEKEKEVVKEIMKVRPDLLFVGFGAPKQEKWLYRWFDKLTIGGAMVIGGTFQYFAGKRRSHPEFIENIGLEWLWRLLTGSQKLSRIFNAFPKFVYTVYRHKLHNHSIY